MKVVTTLDEFVTIANFITGDASYFPSQSIDPDPWITAWNVAQIKPDGSVYPRTDAAVETASVLDA